MAANKTRAEFYEWLERHEAALDQSTELWTIGDIEAGME